ncbi:MAG: hypothetical protein ACE5R6_05900 [Candidatus Heimdallarchaeota archaeon]
MKTLESVPCGLIHLKGQISKNKSKLILLTRYIEKEFTAGRLENPVKVVTCFRLIKIGDQYVCGLHNLWFRSSLQEVIPLLIESSEGTSGCLCYFAAIVIGNFS